VTEVGHAAVTTPKRRVGRPRATGPSRAGADTRADVLAAAARLFSRRGYAATSTRAIAEAAGIRQASVYNHFRGKEEILTVLLEQTVRHALTVAARLRKAAISPEAKLWALCYADVRVLLDDPHNVGALFLLPEVTGEHFAGVRGHRDQLWGAYRDLIARTGRRTGTEELTTRLVCGLVESVIQSRPPEGERDVDAVAVGVAEGVLRLLGCQTAEITAARSAAECGPA
jgi:AcrR family transcriptional regulator